LKFPLEDGHHTEVLFFRDSRGNIIAFPSFNRQLVELQGTKESKDILKKIMIDSKEAEEPKNDVDLVYRLEFFCEKWVKSRHELGTDILEIEKEMITIFDKLKKMWSED